MRKEKIIVVVAAAVLTAFLFYLPKAAVRKNVAIEERGNQTSVKSGSGTALDKPMTPEVEKGISDLKSAFSAEKNKVKRAEIADRLVSLYESFGRIDSTVVWAEKSVEEFDTSERRIVAGDSFYMLFLSETNAQKREKAGEKARAWYGKVGNKDVLFADAQAKIAMTYVPSDNSMPAKTIAILRDVLTKYPDNETALFNLGLLSMQSGQLEKAEERFKKIAEINPQNARAILHLAMVYRELGNEKKATEYLEKVKNQKKDSVSRAAAEALLKESKK